MNKSKDVSGSQMLISGVMTERDVFLAVCRREGAKGGRMRTAKQTEARRRNIQIATAARMNKRKARSEGTES